jgi:hypothetical protein
MVDLESKLKTIQIKWVNIIITGVEGKWAKPPKHWFKQACPKVETKSLSQDVQILKTYLTKISSFYRDALLT